MKMHPVMNKVLVGGLLCFKLNLITGISIPLGTIPFKPPIQCFSRSLVGHRVLPDFWLAVRGEGLYTRPTPDTE